MAKLSDSPTPNLLLEEILSDGSTLANPDADYRKLFLGEDGLLHLKDSGGSVSTLAYAGPNWSSGTSMPGGPSTDDRVTRTDLGMDFYYDGTRWLSATRYDTALEYTGSAMPVTSTQTVWRASVPRVGASSLWLVDWQATFLVSGGTALSASHKWALALAANGDSGTINTYTVDSGSSSVWRNSGQIALGVVMNTTNFQLQVAATKTGTPGDLFALFRLTYRIIGT